LRLEVFINYYFISEHKPVFKTQLTVNNYSVTFTCNCFLVPASFFGILTCKIPLE